MRNKACDKMSQSSIDIPGNAILNTTLEKLELAETWNTSSLTSKRFAVKNKGYTVQLDVGTKDIQTTQGGKTWPNEVTA